MKQLLITIAALVLVGCGNLRNRHLHQRRHQLNQLLKLQRTEPPTAEAPDIDIHDAAYDGNIEAVKQHLDAGTDVDARDGEERLL